MIPEVIGRYEVQCLLGEGAFGQVYAARDPVLSRMVAIKVLRSMYTTDASFMDRFRAEATSLAALAHTNVTAIYDLLQDGPQSGMIMELVRGHTLEHVLKLKSRLALREVLAVVSQAVAGLGFVHRLGVVHRDIKPSNIMLTATGTLKIMDFGIARVQGAKRLTRDGSALGTLAYAAPEQIKSGDGEPRSDQYSLAIVIYEMLSGDLPFEASTEYELMQAHLGRIPDPASRRVPGLPLAVDEALSRALSKNPADRFESVEAFGKALGIEAVQFQAIDIVRDLILGCDVIPAIPERQISRTAVARQSVLQDTASPAASRPPAPARQTAPLVIMGIAAAMALAVGGYILFDARIAPHGSPSTQVATSPPAPATGSAQAATEKPATTAEAAKPKPAETEVAAVVEPPKPPETPLPRVVPVPTAPKAAEKPAPDDGDPKLKPAVAASEPPKVIVTPKPAEPPKSNEAAKPAEPPKPVEAALKPTDKCIPQRLPSEQPTYQGRVVKWLSGTTLMVRTATGGAVDKIVLFGIRDLPTNKQSDVDNISDQLDAYLVKASREITCFTRYSAGQRLHECYAQKTDIACWAIDSKLAEPSRDAPAHYRPTPR